MEILVVFIIFFTNGDIKCIHYSEIKSYEMKRTGKSTFHCIIVL